MKVILLLSVLLMKVRAWEVNVYNPRGCNRGLSMDLLGIEDMVYTELANSVRRKSVLDG